MVVLSNPSSPATKTQLSRLKELTGKDFEDSGITKQKAWDLIEDYELKRAEDEAPDLDSINNDNAFQKPEISLVEGEQRSGKSCYAVKTIITDWYKDAVRVFLDKEYGIKAEVLDYYKKTRSAKVLYNRKKIFIKIPDDYELMSPIKIFSNIHLLGVPFVYIPTFRHAISWLKKGFINGGEKYAWVLLDEFQKGASARGSQSAMNKDFLPEFYQFAKSSLKVIMIAHLSRLIDWTARTIPNKWVSCSYNERTRRITYETRERGIDGSATRSFYAPDWWTNYWTKEKVRT
jgi:hypothetical protein